MNCNCSVCEDWDAIWQKYPADFLSRNVWKKILSSVFSRFSINWLSAPVAFRWDSILSRTMWGVCFHLIWDSISDSLPRPSGRFRLQRWCCGTVDAEIFVFSENISYKMKTHASHRLLQLAVWNQSSEIKFYLFILLHEYNYGIRCGVLIFVNYFFRLRIRSKHWWTEWWKQLHRKRGICWNFLWINSFWKLW